MNRLDGRVALISGAARGIGAETARLMVEAGARVAIGDILDERGRETVQSLGDAALYHHLDVTSAASWEETIAAVSAKWGGLDILVNNAGMFLGKGIEEATIEEWTRLASINMTGVFLGTKLAIPALKERGAGREHGSAIVNLAPRSRGLGRLAARPGLYSMTKGGVTLFTKSSALEFGAARATRSGATSIHLGVIETDMGEQTFYRPRPQPGLQRRRGRPPKIALAHPPDRPARGAQLTSPRGSCSWRRTTPRSLTGAGPRREMAA